MTESVWVNRWMDEMMDENVCTYLSLLIAGTLTGLLVGSDVVISSKIQADLTNPTLFLSFYRNNNVWEINIWKNKNTKKNKKILL